jgi:hypothetical protein
MSTTDELFSQLLCLDELVKVRLTHKLYTGRELTNEEILMTYSNDQILDICEQFDNQIITDYPYLIQSLAALNAYNLFEFTGPVKELAQLKEEIKMLESENEFVTVNSAEVSDDMPDCKKQSILHQSK